MSTHLASFAKRHAERDFLARCHGTKNRIAHASKVITDLSLATRRQRIDAWKALHELVVPTAHGPLAGRDIVSAFRRFLVEGQDNRCCYCRRWLLNNAYARPLDHVLPRKDYPQFSLHFWNFAVACADCNRIKSAKPWGTYSSHRRIYPRVKDFGHHFHPRLHPYDSHVRYARVETNTASIVVYKGLTPQGRQVCRDLLKEVSLQEALIKNNRHIAKSLATLRDFAARDDKASFERFGEFMAALDATIIRGVTVPA